jgi:hypothetical protein
VAQLVTFVTSRAIFGVSEVTDGAYEPTAAGSSLVIVPAPWTIS